MAIYSPSYACSEEHGTVKEDVQDSGTTCSVTLRTAWSLRHSLVYDIVGNRRPWPHTSWPVQPLASQAAIVPDKTAYTTSGQSCTYIDALVTITYSTYILDICAESLEPTAEFLTLDWKRFRWGAKNGDPLLEKEAPGKLVKGLNLVRQLFNRTPPLSTSLLTLMGSSNQAAYTSALLGLTFAKETLIYQPPSLQRTIKTNGDMRFNLTLKFSYKPEGWNKYWRAKSQTWEEIFDVDTGLYKCYPPADYSAFLF